MTSSLLYLQQFFTNVTKTNTRLLLNQDDRFGRVRDSGVSEIICGTGFAALSSQRADSPVRQRPWQSAHSTLAAVRLSNLGDSRGYGVRNF
jgi:hypothetical protein